MQSKAELEKWYEKPDPWGYTKNSDDRTRKMFITGIAGLLGCERTLELGAGEGFLTRELYNPLGPPVECIELSDNAADRLPSPHGVRVDKPEGRYHLIVAAGVLYEQYDYEQMRKWIKDHAGMYVLICHYDKAGIAHDEFGKKLIFKAEFPYRDGTQHLKVYRWAK